MQKRLISLAIFSTLSFATTVPNNSTDLKITIYNDNRAFIRERREVHVNAGEQQLVYEGVPPSVITQSVVPTFEGMHTRLYSQNYIYDLISLDSMLTNSIDKEVAFYTNGENPRLSKGILLSKIPVMIKEENSNNIYTLNSGTQVVFSKV